MTSPRLPLVKAQRSFLSGIRPSREQHGPKVKVTDDNDHVTQQMCPSSCNAVSEDINCLQSLVISNNAKHD